MVLVCVVVDGQLLICHKLDLGIVQGSNRRRGIHTARIYAVKTRARTVFACLADL